jgi:hypothetical protein
MGLFDVMNNGEKELVRKQATKPLPMGTGKSLSELSSTYGKQLGINPNMLASSSLVEGVSAMFNPKGGQYSAAYEAAVEGGSVDPKKYPVDAFYFAGLDNFGPMVEKLKGKGYLPKDLDYKTYPAWNEAVEKSIAKFDNKGNITEYIMPKDLVENAYFGKGKERQQAITEINNKLKAKGITPNQTVAFKNADDMILAKGAYLRELQDETMAYAKKKGITPSREELDYLTMSAYNGGPGAMRELVDQIKSGDKEVTKKGGKRGQVHKHVSKRMGYMGYMSDLF